MPAADVLNYQHAKQRFEREYLNQLLKLTSGHVAEAARLADRNRTEFYRLMQKHGLDPQLFRTDPLTAASASGDKKLSDESST
jgi:two-component system response regulator GlrR